MREHSSNNNRVITKIQNRTKCHSMLMLGLEIDQRSNKKENKNLTADVAKCVRVCVLL